MAQRCKVRLVLVYTPCTVNLDIIQNNLDTGPATMHGHVVSTLSSIEHLTVAGGCAKKVRLVLVLMSVGLLC